MKQGIGIVAGAYSHHIPGGIIKRIITALASGALILGSMGLGAPASAASATPGTGFSVRVTTAKAPAPKIVNGKTTTTKTKNPNASVLKVKLPVLQNSTPKNRKAFTKFANELVNAERKIFDSGRKGGCKNSVAQFEMAPQDKGIHKGRYATVSMSSFMYLCGATASSSARSFTLDLKTGKKVAIGTFVAQDDMTTKVAVANNFTAAKNKCIDELSPAAPRNATGTIPRPIAWTVSSRGIKFHFAKYSLGAGACGVPAVVLPWAEVATATQLKGTVKNRTYVKGLKYNKAGRYYDGAFITTSVQGRKVTLFEGDFWSSGECIRGIRSGKTAILGFQWGQGSKIKVALKDTGANPKLDAAKLGKGWHEATAAEAKMLKSAWGGRTPSATTVCGS